MTTSQRSQSDRQWLKVFGVLDEAQARLYAAQRALELGRGGISQVARLTGLSRETVARGIGDLSNPAAIHRVQQGQLRRRGAGRKRVDEVYPSFRRRLDQILLETTAGDPMTHLRWTCRSTRGIAQQLAREGIIVSCMSIDRYLHETGYSLRTNVKTDEGRQHPDRDGQFRHINEVVTQFLASGDPVISIDAKKKELVGEFKNNGRSWRGHGDPRKVSAYDFPDRAKGKALPYGVYDIAENQALVSVGVTHDTSAFAVDSIRQWWKRLGMKMHPNAKRLLMCSDAGGSNGHRLKGWKIHLQALANHIGLPITVCHYPPGTSKWNKIEHRLFSYISLHWQGEPLVSYSTVIELISSTTTKTGLTVKAEMNWGDYPIGIQYTDEQLEQVNLTRDSFHGDWNYMISPGPAETTD